MRGVQVTVLNLHPLFVDGWACKLTSPYTETIMHAGGGAVKSYQYGCGAIT